MSGLIIFDPENELAGFTTGDDIAVGAYQDIQSDTLYFTDGVNIYEWAGDANNNQTYTWLSGEVRLPAPANRQSGQRRGRGGAYPARGGGPGMLPPLR